MKALFLCAALALPVPSPFAQNGLLNADQVFLNVIRSCVPNHAENPIVFVANGWVQKDLVVAVSWLSPGGFLFIESGYEICAYFRTRGWERVPFMYRKFLIFRKPLYTAA